MALTRNFLKSLSLSGEQIESVIGAHAETVSGLKQEIARASLEAETLPQIQKELDEARQELQLLQDDPWEARYRQLSTEFDKFRQDVTDRQTKAAKETAYRRLLLDAGISQARAEAVLRVTDLEQLAWQEDGFADPEGLSERIRQEWPEFISTTKIHGANTPHPPVSKAKREDLGALPMREYIRRRSGSSNG